MSRENDDRPAPRPAADGDRPAHPTRPAILLLVGVTALIVALAALSSWGRI